MSTLIKTLSLLPILSSTLTSTLPVTLNKRSPQDHPLIPLNLTSSFCFPSTFDFLPLVASDCTNIISNYFQSPETRKWADNPSTVDTLSIPKDGTRSQGSCYIALVGNDPAVIGNFSLAEIGLAASLLTKACSYHPGFGGTQRVGEERTSFYVYVGARAPPNDFNQRWDPLLGQAIAPPTSLNHKKSDPDLLNVVPSPANTLPDYKEKRTHDDNILNTPSDPFNSSIIADNTLTPSIPNYKVKRTPKADLNEQDATAEDSKPHPTAQAEENKDKRSRSTPANLMANDMRLRPNHKAYDPIIAGSSLRPTVPDYKREKRAFGSVLVRPGEQVQDGGLPPSPLPEHSDLEGYDERIVGSTLKPTIPVS